MHSVNFFIIVKIVICTYVSTRAHPGQVFGAQVNCGGTGLAPDHHTPTPSMDSHELKAVTTEVAYKEVALRWLNIKQGHSYVAAECVTGMIRWDRVRLRCSTVPCHSSTGKEDTELR